MPIPDWMHGHPGAPQPTATHPDWLAGHLDNQPAADDTPIGITPCRCSGEGCTTCNGDGVIYP